MAKNSKDELPRLDGNHIRFNLAGLIGFSIALVLAGGLLTSGMIQKFFALSPKDKAQAAYDPAAEINVPEPPPGPTGGTPPWGELIVRDIQLDIPSEYAAYALGGISTKPTTWQFPNLSGEKVVDLLAACGLDSNQIARAVSTQLASFTATNATISPDDELVFSLTPQARERLYLYFIAQTQYGTNDNYWISPFRLNRDDFKNWEKNQDLNPQVLAEIKNLSYERSGLLLFSDLPVVMRHLQTIKERLNLVQTLSRQPACLVRLCIRPDSDVERILGYWSRGVQLKDARPLLNSLKRLEGGGTLSLLYLLPPRVRQKVNTFPYPGKPDASEFNCHWFTMNFFNETAPDDSLADTSKMLAVLDRNYYKIAMPSEYGDVILIRDSADGVLHSAVYLAEDLAVTKNGKNMARPWVITRIKNIVGEYTYNYPPKVEYYRYRGN